MVSRQTPWPTVPGGVSGRHPLNYHAISCQCPAGQAVPARELGRVSSEARGSVRRAFAESPDNVCSCSQRRSHNSASHVAKPRGARRDRLAGSVRTESRRLSSSASRNRSGRRGCRHGSAPRADGDGSTSVGPRGGRTRNSCVCAQRGASAPFASPVRPESLCRGRRVGARRCAIPHAVPDVIGRPTSATATIRPDGSLPCSCSRRLP
jgi:hypothetical protein